MIEEGSAAWISHLPRAGSLPGLFFVCFACFVVVVASPISHALDGRDISPGPMPAFMVRFVACGDRPTSNLQ
jgi:hypothetical protein